MLQAAKSEPNWFKTLPVSGDRARGCAGPQSDGINAVRRMLDLSIIDPVRCAEGLGLLRNYKYEWQERKRVWSPHPRHDFASHCADAFLALGIVRRDKK